MSLFQCELCGCVENTALACQGFKYLPKPFDWSKIPELEGKMLCSACGPDTYRSGGPTEFGKWHDQFSRTFLPLGKFKTNRVGNLEHVDNGDTDYWKYEIQMPDTELDKAGDDLLHFGRSFTTVDSEGNVKRIDPKDVYPNPADDRSDK